MTTTIFQTLEEKKQGKRISKAFAQKSNGMAFSKTNEDMIVAKFDQQRLS